MKEEGIGVGRALTRRVIEGVRLSIVPPRLSDAPLDPDDRGAVFSFRTPTLHLRLVEIVEESASTRTFRFRPEEGGIPAFRAGAHVSLRVDLPGIRTSRSYSISSRPGAEHLDLTVRMSPGGTATAHLFARAKVGDRFESTAPAGAFRREALTDRGDLALLAGGSGIAPFMSLLRERAASATDRCAIHLLYGCRNLEEAAFHDELTRLAASEPWFRYALVLADPEPSWDGPRGWLDAGRIAREVVDVGTRTFLLCGPPAMHDFVVGELGALQVPRHRIRRESFVAPTEVHRMPHWPADVLPGDPVRVRIAGGPTLAARAGDPLIDALEKAGLLVPCGCRSGVCGLCRVHVESGTVFLPPSVALRDPEREGLSWVNACSAYPIGDLVIRL